MTKYYVIEKENGTDRFLARVNSMYEAKRYCSKVSEERQKNIRIDVK